MYGILARKMEEKVAHSNVWEFAQTVFYAICILFA